MADTARAFYGGDPITGAAGGELGAGKYDGPEAHVTAPWKCPACGGQNEGPLPQGCTQCGAGKPGFHVGNPPPDPTLGNSAAFEAVKADITRGLEHTEREMLRDEFMYAAAGTWTEQHPEATPIEIFIAGYRMARVQLAAHMIQAPPVTVDVRALAPHTKAQRTIIAALEIFKDQILSQGPEEISTGEWMSAAEVDELIATLKAQL